MERLPEELLAAVLERLALRDLLAAARVCRRWARAVRRRLLLVRRRGHEARGSRATTALLLTARGADLALALRLAPALTQLAAHERVPLSAAAFRALAALPHLRRLDVFAQSRVLDASLLPAARRLHELVINDAVRPGVLRDLAHAAPSLESLHMYGRSRYYPPRELLALLALRREGLRELTLRCCELEDSAYEAIGACSGLETLRLYSCWMLTGAGAAHVARPRRLRALHVTGARMLRPRALRCFLGALPPRVEELVLSAGWFGDEHCAALGAGPAGAALRRVELWRCRLTARGVVALAAALPALRDLDVDVALGADELRALAAHSALERVRCGGGEAAAWRGALAARPAAARVSRGALRGGGEGVRAELFYSWAGELHPLPAAAPPPAFDDDPHDDDYSLLGSDRDDD